MGKQSWSAKSPEKFMFQTSPLVAEKFREYCAVNRYMIGKVLEDLIIDLLIEEGIIVNRDELSQEQLKRGEFGTRGDTYVRNRVQEEKKRKMEETEAKIEAAIKEAKEHNERVSVEKHSKQ
jgi:hydrogenase maturation factor HypE